MRRRLLGRQKQPDDAERPARALDVDWERIADGRVYRLRRGREFDGASRDFASGLQIIAAERGKVARAVVDKQAPDSIWVQFADAEIGPGEPCTCGNPALRRIHAFFCRCEACGAHLLLSGTGASLPDVDDAEEEVDDVLDEPIDEQAAAPPRGLALLSDVHLAQFDSRPKTRRYVGYGRDASSALLLLVVTVPLVEGNPVEDPSTPLGWVHKAVAMPAEPLRPFLDLDALMGREWELVFR